jgi:FlaA1/EpsC-like NDP-sugar epimerase
MFPKFYAVFNYTTIAVVIIFLVLILTESIPRETYVTLLIITIIILVARIVLRVYLQLYLKKNSKGE